MAYVNAPGYQAKDFASDPVPFYSSASEFTVLYAVVHPPATL